MSLHVSELSLVNFGPFRGEHHVTLSPCVYAVAARYESDPERSNWAGKSSALDALGRFPLFGEQGFSETEDDWITRGEKAGAVKLVLSDGTAIMRSRTRGASTQLVVVRPGEKPAHQDAAQEIIERLVGLSLPDFAASCFFEQKKVARFIVAKPAERMAIVDAWLDLGRLQAAATAVSAQVAELAASRARASQEADAVRAEHERLLAACGGAAPDVAMVAAADSSVSGSKMLLETALAALNEGAEWRQHAREAEQLVTLRAEGQRLAAQLAALPPAPDLEKADAELAEATAAQRTTDARLAELAGLVQGEFGGECPVTCEACPVADKVRERGRRMGAEEAAAKKEAARTRAAWSDARAAQAAARLKIEERRRLEDRIAALREQARILLPAQKMIAARGQPPDPAASEEAVRTAQAAHTESVVAMRTVARAVAEDAALSVRAKVAAESLADHDRRLTTCREALAIFGRNGAQRDVATGALAEIEAGANQLHATSGIDLRLAVRWGREAASGLAQACDQCGAPYPKSQAVKQCAACGATRGPHVVEKLFIDLSNKSGGADDLAGVAFQLSAAAWLRARRGAAWAAVYVDEAFGALDPAHRRALAAHLGTLLGGRYAFAQGFIVAHTLDVIESFAHRLVVTAGPSGSSLVVE